MRTADLVASAAVLVLVAAIMVARARSRGRGPSSRELLREFLRSHPGPVELRWTSGTFANPIVLESPDADRVLQFLGRDGGEVWIVRRGEGAVFIHVPAWGDRR
ncbi:MAG TPA: hypothetical protein VMT03_27845 [Polyangia bacterium]|nr:hypothetical protein [Polyangia bacterium]